MIVAGGPRAGASPCERSGRRIARIEQRHADSLPERAAGPAADERAGELDAGPASQLLTLQEQAGNRAVAGLITGNGGQRALQRAPTAETTDAPKVKAPPKKKSYGPLEVDDLFKTIDAMPWWVSLVEGAAYKKVKGLGYQHGSSGTEAAFRAHVAAVMLFTRDAVYHFGSDGVLREVESNYVKEPTGPNDLPPTKFPMPAESGAVIVETDTKRKWVVYDAGTRLSFEPMGGKDADDAGGSGNVSFFIYAPDIFAADVEGVPKPGWKAKGVKGAGGKDPPWATKQFSTIHKLVKAGWPEGEKGAQGAGLEGTGQGGGGTDIAGTGQARTGTGVGAGAGGAGRGAAEKKGPRRGRRKPDKVVLWTTERGQPMLNVWVGDQHEPIPLKQGESEDALKQRVEEAAARQVSTGKKVADGATVTSIEGIEGGQGAGKYDPSTTDKGARTDANAPAYPSKIIMLAGSGSEVSPEGWATTVAGGGHDFDMILDWDALEFGLANQTFARLQWITYRWQVIDMQSVAGWGKDEREHKQRTQKAIARGDMREASKAERLKTNVARVAEHAGEELEEEAEFGDDPGEWPAKAQQLSLAGVSATWDILKSVISEVIAKITEPENRQHVAFADPGYYVVRCLAIPYENEEIPYEKRTRRATSIFAFPVRVVTLEQRAQEVNQKQKSEVSAAEKELEEARKKLALAADDPVLKKEVELREKQLAFKQKEAGMSTLGRLDAQVAAFDVEKEALKALISYGRAQAILSATAKSTGDWTMADEHRRKGPTQGLTGDVLMAAIRVTLGLGLSRQWEWENRLEDLEKARKAVSKQAETGHGWVKDKLKVGSQYSPRVTLISEENGAVIKMDMVLGEADDSTSEKPSWFLFDVTTKKTQDNYRGRSSQAGAPGHREAIMKAFQKFADEASYGRGTIAIDLADIPETDGVRPVPASMLMKPGSAQRWQHRLQNLVEIAGLVAPFVRGGSMLAAAATVGGAVDAAIKIKDRAGGDRLELDFETIGDILNALAPALEGGKMLAELKGLAKTNTGFVLRTVGRGGDIANEMMFSATIFHGVDEVMRNPNMDPAQKEAAVLMILGRGMRDKSVALLGKQHQYAQEKQKFMTGVDAERNVPQQYRPTLGPELEPVAPRATSGEGGGKPGGVKEEPVARRTRDEKFLDDVVSHLPEHTVMQPPRPRDSVGAREMYANCIGGPHGDPSREAAIYRNIETGEYIVVQGTRGAARVAPGEAPKKGGEAQRWKEILDGRDVGRWQLEQHWHPPSEHTGVVAPENRYPSGANGDMGAIWREAMNTKRARSSQIDFLMPDGPNHTTFGFDPASPKPFWFDVPDGRGGRHRERFETIEAYHAYIEGTFKVKQGAVPEIMRNRKPVGDVGEQAPRATSDAVPTAVPGTATARDEGATAVPGTPTARRGTATVVPGSATARGEGTATVVPGSQTVRGEGTATVVPGSQTVRGEGTATVVPGSVTARDPSKADPHGTALSRPGDSGSEPTTVPRGTATDVDPHGTALSRPSGGSGTPGSGTPSGPTRAPGPGGGSVPADPARATTQPVLPGATKVPVQGDSFMPALQRLEHGWQEVPPPPHVGGSSERIFLQDAHGNLWLFKPASGETELAFGPSLGIQQHERWRRAKAAADLADRLGFDTPDVFLVQWGTQHGSLQAWREGAELGRTVKRDNRAAFDMFWESQTRKDMDVFDFLIANQDRHWENYMLQIVDGKPHLILIDQDSAIPADPRRNYESQEPRWHQDPGRGDPQFWVRDLPQTVSVEVARSLDTLWRNFPEAELRQFLTQAEVDGIRARLGVLINKIDSGRLAVVQQP